jgi:hypothetical protein
VKLFPKVVKRERIAVTVIGNQRYERNVGLGKEGFYDAKTETVTLFYPKPYYTWQAEGLAHELLHHYAHILKFPFLNKVADSGNVGGKLQDLKAHAMFALCDAEDFLHYNVEVKIKNWRNLRRLKKKYGTSSVTRITRVQN